MRANRIILTFAIASALLALGAAASAHGPWAGYGPGRGPEMERFGGTGPMAQPEAAAARMKALEAALQLEPNQTKAFEAYAAKIKTEAAVRAKLHEGMQSRMGDPEAMRDYRVTIVKQQAEALDELNTLRKNLVAVLRPEQKRVLDRDAMGFGAGPRFGGMAWGRGCGAHGV